MKIVKTIAILFALTCVTSLMNVKADGSYAFLAVTIPAAQGNYTSPSVTKTTWSNQYVKSTGATDNVSGDGRAVKARLKNISNSYTTLTKNSYVQLYAGDTGLGTAPNSYQLQVASVNWFLTAASWSGNWILDDYLLP